MIQANGIDIVSDVSEIIDKLKEVLHSNGINLFYKTIDTPNNLMVCCPFHKNGQERKPSMGILKSDGTCHCFSCGWVGSLSEMISGCFGKQDLGYYGGKWLIQNFMSLNASSRPALDLNYDRSKNVLPPNAKPLYVTEAELNSYRYIHPYMYERKMTDEVIEIFDVGYDKNTDCITFPVRDTDGNTLFVARRSVRTKYFNYPSGVDKPVYGIYELIHAYKNPLYIDFSFDEDRPIGFPDEVIICESMIDAITCWAYGKYAVALNGLGTEYQFKQLRSLPCRQFILGTDKDDAGRRARRILKMALENKLVLEFDYNSYPEHAKDINDMSKDEFDSLKVIF